MISDIEPLEGLAQLDRLLLNGNNISDLEPLAGLFNLSYLLLGGNQINDLGPLAGLTGLDHLQFEGNQVRSLAPLANLTELDYLQATSNKISDLSPLEGLHRIRILDINYNKISDISPLANVFNERLSNVGIAYNYIDITPGSEAMNIITYFRDAGVAVLYEPQFETPLPGFDASLSGLSISPGSLSPAFDQDIFSYIVNVEHNVESVNITATLSDDNALLTINGEAVSSGETKEITIGAAGTETTIDVSVTAKDGQAEETYTVTVRRLDFGQAFTDVPTDHPFFTEIGALAESGITTGYDDGTFRPTANVTRMAMAAFLTRGLELDQIYEVPAQPTFPDVPIDHSFFDEIELMVASGISEGYDDGTFRPSANVTRQAMAAFLVRGLEIDQIYEVPAEPTFPDVPIDHPFFDEIELMVASGISEGYDDGTFRPSANVTRMAMAAFLVRGLELED